MSDIRKLPNEKSQKLRKDEIGDAEQYSGG